jgi:PAS domain-containing protein
MSTLLVMAGLLYYSMGKAKDRLDDQRRAQSELESMEVVLQTLLEQGSEVYLTMNLAGRLLSANETTRRYLGLPDVQRNVVCIEDLIFSESHEKMRRLPEALLRGISTNAVLLFKMADGEAMPLYVTAACRMRQGKAEEILLIGRALPLGLRSPQASQSLLASA